MIYIRGLGKQKKGYKPTRKRKKKLLMFFFFLRECSILWHPFLMIVFYHQTKTLIDFWCKQKLNPKFLI